MEKNHDRSRYIRQAKWMQRSEWLMVKTRQLFANPAAKAQRKLVYFDTGSGIVRTLCYGWDQEEKSPVYFDLHGGGFVLGGPEMDHALNLQISRQVGCKIISVGYAKAPDHPYPAAVNQVYALVKHVFENAEAYAIDPRCMAIGGHSAGANISTVVCMKAKDEGRFRFACQILDYPPLDLATDPTEKPHPKGSLPNHMTLMFNACYVSPTQARDAFVSPVYASEERLRDLPPALFVLAGRDSLREEGLKYNAMLQAAGVATECYEYPNAAHGFTLSPSGDTTDALGKMAAFLKRYFK